MVTTMTDLTAGTTVQLSPLVRRIVAPNPSVFTGPGTNTYLVGPPDGDSPLAVIDPGPNDPRHLAVLAEAARDRIGWILATHTHSDHAPGCTPLQQLVGGSAEDMPVLGFSAREGFEPDATIGDGWVLDTADFRLRALHTPGHAGNHLCFLLEQESLLFSGDHIMNGSTVVIGPPDGDMGAYLEQLERLRPLGLAAIAPGHGDFIADPAAKIDEYVTHRLAREKAVVDALSAAGTATVEELVPPVYADVSAGLHAIAARSLWAHLRKLGVEGRARCDNPDDIKSPWTTDTR